MNCIKLTKSEYDKLKSFTITPDNPNSEDDGGCIQQNIRSPRDSRYQHDSNRDRSVPFKLNPDNHEHDN